MISKEADELLQKMSKLKTPQSQQGKKVKQLTQDIISYEAKIKKWLVKFDAQMGDVEQEVKTMRERDKEEEDKVIQEIDNYELSLKNLLSSYSKQAARASEKLNEIVTNAKQEMKNSLKEHQIQKKESLASYKALSERLETMIENVRTKQKNSMENMESIRSLIRSRANQLSQRNQLYLQKVSNQSQQLTWCLNELQEQVDSELLKLVKRQDESIFQTNKIINRMVQFASEN